jgi:hypothetical protein
VPGPHGFAVRNNVTRPARVNHSRPKGRPAISRARNAIASTAARTPRIVTTRTSLFDEAGWREEDTIYREGKVEYFWHRIWTTQITLNRLVKLASAREAFQGVLDGRQQDRTAQPFADLPVGRAKGARPRSSIAKPDNCISEMPP